MPITVRATLIQCISELQAYLRPPLEGLVAQHAFEGAVLEDALQWILAEELELIYGLFENRHQLRRQARPYNAIYSAVQQLLPVPLSRLVSHYVAAPRIYSDNNQIDLYLRGPDLFLHYYRHPYEVLPQIVKY